MVKKEFTIDKGGFKPYIIPTQKKQKAIKPVAPPKKK